MSNIIYNTILQENISFYSNLNQEQSLNLYKQIIKFRKINKLSKDDIYCENHHIIPKSICKDKLWKEFDSNKVNLLAYEHFICHYLLTKIFDDTALVNAFWMLCNASAETNKREYIDNLNIFKESKEYEILREKFSKRQSINSSGKNNGMFGVHRYGIDSPNYGKRRSEEIKKKMSVAQKLKNKTFTYKNGMINKMWIYNVTLDIQAAIDKNECIPDGYIKGKRPYSKETIEKIKIAHLGKNIQLKQN